MKINIAIDGPSAAGKSTIADILALKLGYVHLDTGAMYRTVAYIATRAQIKLDDEASIVELISKVNLEMLSDGTVLVDGEDVSKAIRSNEMSMASSNVSKLPKVREALVAMQQKIAANKGYILDGRDIGTVVLKDAEVKIYLTASAESRANRRVSQNIEKGYEANYDAILADIIQRDYQDMHREFSPLTKADDAIEIDSSDITKEEVVTKILEIVNQKLK